MKLFVVVAVVVLSVFVLGGGTGASQLPGGEGGRVSFGVGCDVVVVAVLSVFVLGGAGGQSALELCCLVLRGMEASQLPGGKGGRVSFGVGCETVRRRRRRRLFLFPGL